MFATSIAGSLPKPAWLAETHKLWPQWKAEGDALLQAKADATLLWIKAQEDAGLDIVCDGEQARQHFVHGFLEQVEGIDFQNKVTMGIRNNRYDAMVPQVVAAAADLGVLLLDGLADGIWIDAPGFAEEEIRNIELMILQAARVRFSHTEYIACPSCGRTLYDIEKTLAAVKSRTSHLKNLKIGVMGCIVNGPGEMADADYGYVGAGKNRISLYKGKECVLKNIPEEEAVERLVQLIKESGDWTDH